MENENESLILEVTMGSGLGSWDFFNVTIKGGTKEAREEMARFTEQILRRVESSPVVRVNTLHIKYPSRGFNHGSYSRSITFDLK